jgi:hypothetical protein
MERCFIKAVFRVDARAAHVNDPPLLSERLIAEFKDVLEWIHPGDNFAALDHGFANKVPPPIGLRDSHPCRRIHALDRGQNDAVLHAAPVRHDWDHLILRGFVGTVSPTGRKHVRRPNRAIEETRMIGIG